MEVPRLPGGRPGGLRKAIPGKAWSWCSLQTLNCIFSSRQFGLQADFFLFKMRSIKTVCHGVNLTLVFASSEARGLVDFGFQALEENKACVRRADRRTAFLLRRPDLQGSEGPLPCTDAGRYYKSDQSEAPLLKKSPQAHTNVGMANEMGVAWGSGSAGGALEGTCPRVHCFHLSPLSSSPEWPAAQGGVGSLRWGPETETGKSHSLR